MIDRYRNSLKKAILETRRPFIISAHIALFSLAFVLAYALRFDAKIPINYLEDVPLLLLFAVSTKTAAFAYFRLFTGLWRYSSFSDVVEIIKATVVALLALILLGVVSAISIPRSIYLLDWGLTFGLTTGLRFTIRGYREWLGSKRAPGERRAIVVGAGDAAEDLLRSLKSLGGTYEIVGLVDDDRRKRGAVVRGAKVLGKIDELPVLAKRLEAGEALLALPSAPLEERRRITQVCRDAGVVVRTVPPLRDLVEGRASIGELEPVSPEDLLRRERVDVDLEALRNQIRRKRVLVTGAAGSIGLELCLQIASFEPTELLLFERAESSLYFAALELKRKYPDLRVRSVVGDICDRHRVAEVFDYHKPELVYHAAAYKHVPLMEDHPLEAIQNNVFGTEIVARQAAASRVERFVLVSTDKAVAPVGVMGMTKRVAEGVVLALGGGDTVFTAVRFGNVLGSDGSVLPLFRWQLASQAAITITDEEATRYFMLISEAAQLVMQAGVMAEGGEVFFLDMGQPVNIKKMAEDLIRLSGKRPGTDIEIQMTGLRPGERLTEELIRESEELLPTAHSQVARSVVRNFNATIFADELDSLRLKVDQRDTEGAVACLARIAGLY